ncbi:MAG: serine/threonine protein kinase [Pyrinomonadaceae bacterium]|nr:serine/threonine protein kinase [Pyrinomonadaceae bacterium]
MIAPDTLLQNRYLVQKQIGQGGMGAVYVATDQRFGSTVALKETFFTDPNLRKAFEREARLLNHLRHPALPRVSDHFTEDDGQFLVMEFIPGPDLSEMLKEKGAPFPLTDVLNWADQLLDALDYLHTHEPAVIHRDIKPQNLKLTARGHIVLLDFGLAKGTPLQASRVTATGSLFGYSFNYAPLEQMQGTGTDPRSDLYSLGATLYHLMTNLTPPDAITRATALVNGEPDPLRPASEVHAQVSSPVAQVLMHAMAQSAAKRPQTAAEMRDALRDASGKSTAANLPTVVQTASVSNLQEQDTQLIGERTGTAAAEAATTIKEAGAAAATGLHEAATVIQPVASASAASPLTKPNRNDESVLTKVRPEGSQASRRLLSVRALGIVMSVVLLAIVAAGAVYIFKKQHSTQPATIQDALPPSDPPTPAPSANVDAQAPAPSPVPTAAPAQEAQQASTAPKKIIIRKHNKNEENPQPEEIENDAPGAPPETPDSPDIKRHPGLSPEERARIDEEVRRAKQQINETEMKRREALRWQRQQQRRERRRRAGLPIPPQ